MLKLNGASTVIWHHFDGYTRNAHGKQIPSYRDEELADVGLDVPRADEPRDNATERERIDLVAYLPPGIKVHHRDQFTIDGEIYGVEGSAPPLQNMFTAALFRTEVNLRKVEG